MAEPILISVVVPVYNEEDSIPVLHEEIGRVLERMGLTDSQCEVIYVDDCSTDASLHRILEIRRRDARVRAIKFRRNFGQTSAMAAGFEEARGRVVATLDADLQNDPADIPRLVDKLEQGYDVVAGWRKVRHDAFVVRRVPSLVANRLIAFVTGVPIHDTGCTLKVFRRELLKNISIYADQHRFLPVLSAGSGAKVAEVVVNHRPRRYGHSKYGLGRATRVLLDLLSVKLISQFSQRPVQYFGVLGFLALSAGLLFATASMLGMGVFTDPEPTADGSINKWEMAVLTILLLLSSVFVYFTFLGLLGELAVKASGMHRRSTLDRILNELH